MEYRSLFNADFKHSLPSQFRRKRHHFLLPSLTIGIIMVMGVVVAKVNIAPSKPATAEADPVATIDTIELNLEGKSDQEPVVKYRQVETDSSPQTDAVETGQKIETVKNKKRRFALYIIQQARIK